MFTTCRYQPVIDLTATFSQLVHIGNRACCNQRVVQKFRSRGFQIPDVTLSSSPQLVNVDAASVPVSAVILEISRSEIVTIVVPMIGNILYFPVRLTIWPTRIDVINVPPISGTMRNPVSKGVSSAIAP